MSRADRLRAFLDELQGKPVEWGASDCSAAPARWVEREAGVCLGLPAYRSREEAHALIAAAGGLDRLWSDRLEAAGIFERIGEPELGDVAVIDTRRYGQIGGICAAGGILLIRKDAGETGGWKPFGPVRRFVKVWAV